MGITWVTTSLIRESFITTSEDITPPLRFWVIKRLYGDYIGLYRGYVGVILGLNKVARGLVDPAFFDSNLLQEL